MLTGNSAVILIDYWESEISHENEIRRKLFQNIIDTVPTIPNLELVIHSSYDQEKYTPNQTIHNHIWPCKKINLFHVHELKDYLNKEKIEIENFVIMGMHWDRCIKNRDLGWKSLKEHFYDKKIFTVEDCILSLDNHKKISYWTTLQKDSRCRIIEEKIYQIVE